MDPPKKYFPISRKPSYPTVSEVIMQCEICGLDHDKEYCPRCGYLSREGYHGVECPKVEHVGSGYLHGEGDDSPYDVDGVDYCGRCHRVIG